MIFKRNIFVLSLCLWAFSVTAQDAVSVEYLGTYKSGEASFSPKTKIKITKTGTSYEITPVAGSNGPSLSLPLASMRGAALSGDKNVWIYWFDAADVTKSALFELEGGAITFVESVTRDVTDFNNRPAAEAEAVKARYEEYRDRALRESR